MIERLLVSKLFASCLVAVALLGGCASIGTPSDAPPPSPAEDPLPAWSDTAVKQAILDFVARVTRPGGPDYVPPDERLATFDFDGTIGCEKPDYMEVVVAMLRLCELTADQPTLLLDPLYHAACTGDSSTIDAKVEATLLKAFLGESQSFYSDYVEEFLRKVHHPRFDRPYGQLYYVPMLELIELLHSHDFTVAIVSGSQQGFTRSFGVDVLGLEPAHLIGSMVELTFSIEGGSTEDESVEGGSTGSGKAMLIRQDAFRAPSVGGKGKAEVIRNRLGQAPVLAFGNSMGDFEMLRYATGGKHPGLGLILVHDDPDEYVYSDQELIERAKAFGWHIVGMKDSFEVIFPQE